MNGDDQIILFRVLFNEDRTRLQTDHDVMGWGIQFPSGSCYIDWNREAFAPDDRLEKPHVSIYGTLDDVEQGTGGDIEQIHKRPAYRKLSEADQ